MLIKAPFRFFIKAGYVFVPGFCNYALYFAVMLIYWISPQKLLYMMFGGKMLKYAGYLGIYTMAFLKTKTYTDHFLRLFALCGIALDF